MSTTTFSLIIGVAFTLVGIAGMFPAALTPPPADAPALSFNALHGYLFGLFPVNLAHNVVHLVIGIAGLAAASGERYARLYARGLAVFYGALAVLGLLPGPNTLFGLLPLHGHDIWLHLGTAALAAYFGWRAEIPVLSESDDRRYGIADRRRSMTRVVHERRRGAYDRRMPLGT